MAALWSPLCFVLLVGLSCFLQSAAATCFWPDRSVVTTYVACNSTADGVTSVCCDSGDVCSTRGCCMGASGFMYRGGCTDQNWSSPNCAAQCKQVATNSFSNMYPCPVQPGSYTKYWCCGLTEGLIAERHGECCKDGNFTFEATGGTGPFFSRDYNKTEPVSSSTPTTTLTLATTGSTSTFTLATADSATSPPAAKAATNRTSDKRDMTIGVAIAVPIAVITLSLLGVVLVREHRGRKHAEKMANDMMKAGHQSEGSRAHGRSLDPTGEMSESDRRQMTQELSSAPILLVELQSGQIYEAGGGS